ncbi:hypothetical protein BJX66DRAFT_28013 [Aspergillus keveii]|uniref:Uncharacterized protein n=1 Tax=Aspergillus keveii TaxID=714993 RepID=A0ABR4FTM3_9EURO
MMLHFVSRNGESGLKNFECSWHKQILYQIVWVVQDTYITIMSGTNWEITTWESRSTGESASPVD